MRSKSPLRGFLAKIYSQKINKKSIKKVLRIGKIEKKDAIEFVKESNGGWDCIILDPPYMSESEFQKFKGTDKKSSLAKIKHRLVIDYDKYLIPLINLITQKVSKQYWIVKFFNRYIYPGLESSYTIMWYKGKQYGGMGGFVRRNVEFINITGCSVHKRTPRPRPNIQYSLKEVEEIPPPKIPLAKPILLFEKIFKFTDCKYVLDPFAGSYASYYAAKNQGIQIDACDLYTDPPLNKPRLEQFY